MQNLTEKFVDALGELHRTGDAGPIAELFSDDATLTKAGLPHGERGKDGAKTFWKQYREVFGDIESSFSHRVVDDGIAYLEWTSTGTLRDGTDFTYDGISVLEGDGDTIDAFRTYYDSAAFLSAERKSGAST
ncbi:nuclear transport factor 2 family protein [Mycobacterium sp. MYCO198283]|uniref:nuclear transport factor 2 family protein n=1 Tax=Mycobacterium sp. MYCO198283 TaxID=2883505 RepID=UPI001E3C3CA3|nr:nuclear transport factor 2 family protein [Mycobacterium sp. MYCO198283]MCG5434098.1 nuclear transport factor 2 family protein [Mycobacterium sp. MYCO198283]